MAETLRYRPAPMTQRRRRREYEPGKVTIRRMDTELWEQFRIACIRRGMYMGDQLNIILRDWLAVHEPPPPPRPTSASER